MPSVIWVAILAAAAGALAGLLSTALTIRKTVRALRTEITVDQQDLDRAGVGLSSKQAEAIVREVLGTSRGR